MYLKPPAHLRQITQQAEAHAPPLTRNREQYLNKIWTCVRESVHGFEINWLSLRVR